MTILTYKVYDTKDKTWAAAGMFFTSKGKSWSSSNAMRSAFTQWLRRGYMVSRVLPASWVVFILSGDTETGIATLTSMSARQFYDVTR